VGKIAYEQVNPVTDVFRIHADKPPTNFRALEGTDLNRLILPKTVQFPIQIF
jgi:hypothetical protein